MEKFPERGGSFDPALRRSKPLSISMLLEQHFRSGYFRGRVLDTRASCVWQNQRNIIKYFPGGAIRLLLSEAEIWKAVQKLPSAAIARSNQQMKSIIPRAVA
jgi:hypothetical protein